MAEQNRGAARVRAWAAMLVVSAAVALVTFAVFFLLGGFMLLVALNGFTSKQAEPVFIVYTALMFAGATIVAALCNWLILRRGFPAAGLPAWLALVPAAGFAFCLLVAPALFFIYA